MSKLNLEDVLVMCLGSPDLTDARVDVLDMWERAVRDEVDLTTTDVLAETALEVLEDKVWVDCPDSSLGGVGKSREGLRTVNMRSSGDL